MKWTGKTVSIDLDEYQAANLLDALWRITDWNTHGDQFSELNSGDWVCEVAYKLGALIRLAEIDYEPNLGDSEQWQACRQFFDALPAPSEDR